MTEVTTASRLLKRRSQRLDGAKKKKTTMNEINKLGMLRANFDDGKFRGFKLVRVHRCVF